MIVMGAAFKIFSFSYDFARWLSCAFMVISFVLILLMSRHYGFPVLSMVRCGLFFMDRRYIAAGNIARMDVMLLCAICVGTILLQRGMVYKGFSMLCLSPLIHSNGVLFIAGAIGYWCADGRLRRRRLPFSLMAGVCSMLMAGLWIGYAIYTAAHWQWFLHDMGYQISRKGSHAVLSGLCTVPHLAILFLMFFCGM